MQTAVLTIETPAHFSEAAALAAKLLQAGEIVAVPTETVYGLAANALDPNAVKKIYEAKGRPAHNPIIVHVASLEMAGQCASEWPEAASVLARRFWPGPLTLVLPKAAAIPPIVTAGGATVGIRWPLHPFMRELIRLCGFPLAAPSANPANAISPTSGDHVLSGLQGRIPLLVDAGPSSVGIESTVLDLSVTPTRLLRPGIISAEQIALALGQPVANSGETDAILKSPGRLKKHYAPHARLVLASWREDADLERQARALNVPMERVHVITCERIPRSNPYGRVVIIPLDPEAYARALYAELHRSDQLGAGLILVEMPPPGSDWEAIRDRLRRASGEG